MSDNADNSADDPDVPEIPGDTEEERLAEAMRILDAAPPELVQQMILKRGSIGIALDQLKNLAMSDDPAVRSEARRLIREDGLDLLLIEEEDPDIEA